MVWYEGSGTTDRRWLHSDERGSVVAVTNSAGCTLAINSYDEYGIPAATNLGRFQYTGQAWLPELGLYYYKARMYSPTLGRFMQTDPIGYGGGINWYNYVGSDPVNATDPSGLAEVEKNLKVLPIAPNGDEIFVTATRIDFSICNACGNGPNILDSNPGSFWLWRRCRAGRRWGVCRWRPECCTAIARKARRRGRTTLLPPSTSRRKGVGFG